MKESEKEKESKESERESACERENGGIPTNLFLLLFD